MSDDKNSRASLDKAPAAPPEMMVRKGLGSSVASRDAEQNTNMPGMGGPNAIGQRAMAAEQAIGQLAQVLPDPAPMMDIIARLRAAVVAALQSPGVQPPQAQGGFGGMAGAPPAAQAPAAGGMPAPPPAM